MRGLSRKTYPIGTHADTNSGTRGTLSRKVIGAHSSRRIWNKSGHIPGSIDRVHAANLIAEAVLQRASGQALSENAQPVHQRGQHFAVANFSHPVTSSQCAGEYV